MFTVFGFVLFIASTTFLPAHGIDVRRVRRHAQMMIPMYSGMPHYTGGGETTFHKQGAKLGAGLLGVKASVGLHFTKGKNHTYENFDSNAPMPLPLPMVPVGLPPPPSGQPYPPYGFPPPPFGQPYPPYGLPMNSYVPGIPSLPFGEEPGRAVRSIRDYQRSYPNSLAKIMPKITEEYENDSNKAHGGIPGKEVHVRRLNPASEEQSSAEHQSGETSIKGALTSDVESYVRPSIRVTRSPAEVPNRYTVNVEEDKKKRGSFNRIKFLGLGALLNLFIKHNTTKVTEEFRSGNIPRQPDLTKGLYTRKRSLMEDWDNLQLSTKNEILRKHKKYRPSPKIDNKYYELLENQQEEEEEVREDTELKDNSKIRNIILESMSNTSQEITDSENEFATVQTLLNSSFPVTNLIKSNRSKRSPQFGNPLVSQTQENFNSLRGVNNKWNLLGLHAKLGLNVGSNRTLGTYQFDSFNPGSPMMGNGQMFQPPQLWGGPPQMMTPPVFPAGFRSRRSSPTVMTIRSGRRFMRIPEASEGEDNNI